MREKINRGGKFERAINKGVRISRLGGLERLVGDYIQQREDIEKYHGIMGAQGRIISSQSLELESLKGMIAEYKMQLRGLQDKKSIIDILSSCIVEEKKYIILCEGEGCSLDCGIYSILYPDALILPSGTCEQVIRRVKIYRTRSEIFWGIVDKDKRSLNGEQSLNGEGIYSLSVRAIENLMAIDRVCIQIMNEIGINPIGDKLRRIKDFALKNKNNIDMESLKCSRSDNVLLFYDPKKVISLISNFIGISEERYVELFFKLLKNGKIRRELFKGFIPENFCSHEEKNIIYL